MVPGANHLAAIQGKRTPVYYSHGGLDDSIRFSTVVLNDEGIVNRVLVLEMSLDLLLETFPLWKKVSSVPCWMKTAIFSIPGIRKSDAPP